MRGGWTLVQTEWALWADWKAFCSPGAAAPRVVGGRGRAASDVWLLVPLWLARIDPPASHRVLLSNLTRAWMVVQSAEQTQGQDPPLPHHTGRTCATPPSCSRGIPTCSSQRANKGLTKSVLHCKTSAVAGCSTWQDCSRGYGQRRGRSADARYGNKGSLRRWPLGKRNRTLRDVQVQKAVRLWHTGGDGAGRSIQMSETSPRGQQPISSRAKTAVFKVEAAGREGGG